MTSEEAKIGFCNECGKYGKLTIVRRDEQEVTWAVCSECDELLGNVAYEVAMEQES